VGSQEGPRCIQLRGWGRKWTGVQMQPVS